MKAKDLRNSILQMAVQGKLVAQDPADEPASVLLGRIREERAKLIKEKKIRAPKGGESVIYLGSDGSRYEKRGNGEPVCIDDEIPFEIPKSWEWARLDTVASVLNGDRGKNYPAKSKLKDEGIPFVSAVNIENGIVSTSQMKYLNNEQFEALRAGKLCCNDIVFCIRGSLGKFGVFPFKEGAIASSLVIVRAYDPDSLTLPFLQLLFDSSITAQQIKKQNNGTAQPNLAANSFMSFLYPIPPLPEQRRIAERISELMPLVEEYGKLEDEREALDAALPERLRKSVLQMAVEGKLVAQDPADEPASALLARIRAERAELIKEKKIKAPKGGESVIYLGSDGRRYEKRGKGEPVCIDGEIPFDIPEGWEWARLGSIFDMQAGKNITASNISDTSDATKGIPCFGGNGIRGYVAQPNREGNHQIIGRQGALCGCVNYAQGPFYATEHAVVVTTFGGVGDRWTGLILRGLNLNQYATATAQPGLAVSKIAEVLVPIPPLAEQRRIAGCASELTALITNQ